MNRKAIKAPNSRLPTNTHALVLSDLLSSIDEVAADGDYRTAYLKREVLSKLADDSIVPLSLRRDRAIAKWLDTEQRNKRTNVRLYCDSTSFNVGRGRKVSSDDILSKAACFVRDLIGEHVPDSVWDTCSFSSGASTSRRRGESDPAKKFEESVDVTPAAYTYVYKILGAQSLWRPNLKITAGNVLFTVPKSSDIERCACKEPDMNMYLQKGVGNFIRRKLRQCGIDLNDQSRNQEYARYASEGHGVTTMDLSSASDSLTCQLACRLFSPEWFITLMDLRSPITVVDGDSHENEMLSSMGNGYTFEVESLVFWALARAVAYYTGTRGRILVYGDDIIVPSAMYPCLKDVLGFCGFIVNRKKSHSSGWFRESCGAHWFKGLDVTPFYIRRPIVELVDLIHLLNQVRKFFTIGDIVDPRVFPFWTRWAKLVPRALHGGTDLDSVGSLCSRTGGRKELKRSSSILSRNGYGGYCFWHHAVGDRSHQTSVQTSHTTSSGRYVVRKHKVQYDPIPLFYDEKRRELV